MNKNSERVYDFLAGLLGVFGVDWDEDFADDGYGDLLGRERIAEPVFLSDLGNEACIKVAALPKKRRA